MSDEVNMGSPSWWPVEYGLPKRMEIPEHTEHFMSAQGALMRIRFRDWAFSIIIDSEEERTWLLVQRPTLLGPGPPTNPGTTQTLHPVFTPHNPLTPAPDIIFLHIQDAVETLTRFDCGYELTIDGRPLAILKMNERDPRFVLESTADSPEASH